MTSATTSHELARHFLRDGQPVKLFGPQNAFDLRDAFRGLYWLPGHPDATEYFRGMDNSHGIVVNLGPSKLDIPVKFRMGIEDPLDTLKSAIDEVMQERFALMDLRMSYVDDQPLSEEFVKVRVTSKLGLFCFPPEDKVFEVPVNSLFPNGKRTYEESISAGV